MGSRTSALRSAGLAAVLATVSVLPLVGCSTTEVTQQRSVLDDRRIRKPDRIIVHDFAASPADVYPGSWSGDVTYQPGYRPSTKEERAGRELGALLADRLVDAINDMGLRAVHAREAAPARPGDIVLVGHFESVDEGSGGKRVMIGFGSGKAEVVTAVQGYLMTESGLRKLGSGTVDAGGSKGPGMIVPIAVTAATANPIGLVVAGAAKAEGEISGRTKAEGAVKRTADAIAERLEERFEQQGWI